MDKIIIAVLIVLLTAIAFMAGFTLNTHTNYISGNSIADAEKVRDYSWTKAVCDDNRTCMDIYVECNGNKVLNITPLTGFVTFDDSWVDRTDWSQGLCPHF